MYADKTIDYCTKYYTSWHETMASDDLLIPPLRFIPRQAPRWGRNTTGALHGSAQLSEMYCRAEQREKARARPVIPFVTDINLGNSPFPRLHAAGEKPECDPKKGFPWKHGVPMEAQSQGASVQPLPQGNE